MWESLKFQNVGKVLPVHNCHLWFLHRLCEYFVSLRMLYIIQMFRPSWCKQIGQIYLPFKQAWRQQWNLSNLCYCPEKVISIKLIIYSSQPLVENTLHWCFLLLGCLLLNLPWIDFTERDRQPALTAQAGPWRVEKKLCSGVLWNL